MARGQFSRVRIRAGYLRCNACHRDFPEEEFKQITRRYKNGSTRTFRDSWCKDCHYVYAKKRRQHLMRTQPEKYREMQRLSSRNQDAKLRRMRREEREIRAMQAKGFATKLLRREGSVTGVARAIGADRKSVKRWLDGTGRPSERHIEALMRAVEGNT